jgi:hypothetical protein
LALVSTAGVTRVFSSVCSPLYGGIFQVSLKSSGGRGAMPAFCVPGAGAASLCAWRPATRHEAGERQSCAHVDLLRRVMLRLSREARSAKRI